MANIDFPSNPTAGQQYTFAGVTYTFSAQGVWIPGFGSGGGGGGGGSLHVVPQGRLTLQSGVPVTVTTVAAVTSLFYTPYAGNGIPLYTGAFMVMRAFGEIAVATGDSLKNPGPIVANKVNDWFVWDDAGIFRLTHGPDWTDNVTRSAGTELVRVSGVLLNKVAITNGPAAERGTYVGTTRSNASAQLNFTYAGAAPGGVMGRIDVWNAYNRVAVTMQCKDTTDSYTYESTTPRIRNGSANNKIVFVNGLAEDGINVETSQHVTNSAHAIGFIAIYLDGASTATAGGGNFYESSRLNIEYVNPGVQGYHEVAAYEYASAVQAPPPEPATFSGDAFLTFVGRF